MTWKFKKMFSVKNYKPRRNRFPHYSTRDSNNQTNSANAHLSCNLGMPAIPPQL